MISIRAIKKKRKRIYLNDSIVNIQMIVFGMHFYLLIRGQYATFPYCILGKILYMGISLKCFELLKFVHVVSYQKPFCYEPNLYLDFTG